LPILPAFDAPLGGSHRNIAITFVVEKLECTAFYRNGDIFVWLPDSVATRRWKKLKMCLFVLTESTNLTDGRTNGHRMTA